MKYIFTAIQNNDEENTKIVMEVEAESFDLIIPRVKEFFLGCGFHPDTVNEYFTGE